jgi:hypothetical protein
MTLEDKVMSESPEYKTANSQYFIETGDSEENSEPGFNSYAEPPAIRFSNKNADEAANSDAGRDGNLGPGLERKQEQEHGSSDMGKFLDDGENKAGFSKEDIDDIEANAREDERVKDLVDRFDPELVGQYNDVTEDDSTAKTADKKGNNSS